MANPIHAVQLSHARDHIHALMEAAEAERLAAEQRRLHREEHELHPAVDHAHEPNGVRRVVGHALIGLGAAIAGGTTRGEARRPV